MNFSQNILAAKAPSAQTPLRYLLTTLIADRLDEELTFIHPDDVELYNKWDSKAFELQVANHELLGHGSGKLFEEDADGKKNFDIDKVRNFHVSAPCNDQFTFCGLQVVNPLTGKKMYVNNIEPQFLFDTFPAARPGINRAKPLARSSGRCPRQWRSAALRRLHCTVSPKWLMTSALGSLRPTLLSSPVVSNPDILRIFNVGTPWRRLTLCLSPLIHASVLYAVHG